MRLARLISLLLLTASAACGAGAGAYYPIPNANQDQVNGGIDNLHPVTPATMSGRAGESVFGFGNPNSKSNQVQSQGWQVTNNVFSSSPNWATAQTGWLTNSDGMLSTNGVLAHTGGASGIVGHTANTAFRGNSRYRSTFIIGPQGFQQVGNLMAAGFSTNTPAGTLPADNSFLFGISAAQVTQQFAAYRSGGGSFSEGSFGNITWTNGTYGICISTDPSNICVSAVWPGHTNEFRAYTPWANFAVTGLTNFIACYWAGTNGTLGNAGGRISGPQTITPRLGVEDVSDFVTWTVDANVGVGQSGGDIIRLVIPAQYDTGTNIGNLMLFLHGNGGTYKGDYEGLVGDEPTNGESIITYFNALTTNNYILASYSADQANGGFQDTWGTSNSIATIDALIAYVRQRYAFSNIYLWGESAGGTTALNYAASKHEKIAGILMNHAVYSSSNTYNAGINVGNINTAYGGSTVAQLATVTNANGFISGDPRGLPANAFYGVPIRINASTQDATVIKSNQTDLLVTLMGGTIGANVKTSLSPEIDDNAITNGFPAQHGSQCYTPAVTAGDLAFLARCALYASADSSLVGGDMTVSGSLIEKGNNVTLYSNTLPLTTAAGAGKLWLSNYDLYWVTPLKTNPIAQGH